MSSLTTEARLGRSPALAVARRRWTASLGLVIGLLTLVACYPIPAAPTATPLSTIVPPTAAPTAAATRPPVASIIGNLSYGGVLEEPITLRDGVAEYSDGSSGKPSVRLVPDSIVTGDLDADGKEDAVAVLRNETSGTGRFVYLVAVLDVSGEATPTQALMIGDRIIVKSLAARDGKVTAELVVQGPNDGLCCPTLDVTKAYALGAAGIAEQP
jgi:hypothetical protein